MFLIQDQLIGSGEHLVELFFHPAVPIAAVDGLRVRLQAPHGDCWVLPVDAPPGLRLEQQPGWLSRGYGLREPATVLVYRAQLRLPVTLRTRLDLVEAREA